VYVFGKQLGTTSLTAIDVEGGVIAVVDLVVTFDIEGLKGRLFELMPDARVEIRPASDALLLSGEVPSAERLAQVLAVAERFAPDRVTNLMSVGGSQQVMLAVRFAEVQRDTIKLLGLNTNLLFESGDAAFQLQSGDGVSIDPLSFATGAISVVTGDIALDVLIDTLEEKGVVTTLAEPNLITLSGDTASFLAGGEFPVPVEQEDEGITIEFKPFGVGLSFTPTVLGNELINLVLVTEVSDIDPTVSVVTLNLEIPGLSVRRAKTTVELRDGQSFAIAGLLRDDYEDTVRQYPLLGDIPILGTLFRSSEFQNNRTELVVIVTPHLVQPAPAGTLITPTDNFVPPTDFELFLLGRTEGATEPYFGRKETAGVLARPSAGGIVGPYGYILE
jgi:pilus assembly protein CpaC